MSHKQPTTPMPPSVKALADRWVYQVKRTAGIARTIEMYSPTEVVMLGGSRPLVRKVSELPAIVARLMKRPNHAEMLSSLENNHAPFVLHPSL